MLEKLIDNFKEIVTKKYFCFEGRAGRSEFWLFWLVMLIANIIFACIPQVGELLRLIWTLGLLLPYLGVMVRRLHDRNISGWWMLTGVIVIGVLILLLLCIPEGSKEPNKYGEPVA